MAVRMNPNLADDLAVLGTIALYAIAKKWSN